ncbi:hypothetical protein GIB67_018579 [Kingdonia uniflora]|uniref:RST domain-containing protein n=1 Tax=Kingdonia uniflora TaxID=39325 RepID=A0A7J7L8I2_9MAGN|nr:hypothetical protein GIB67_018579 [Kingdonia uniflora]
MEPHSLQIADKSEAQISEQSHEHFLKDRIRHPDNQHQYPKLPSVSNQQTLAVNPTNNPVGNEQTMAAHPTNIPISNKQTFTSNPTNNPVRSRQALAANPANNPVSNQHTLAANPTKNHVINHQALAASQSNNSATRPKQVPFGMLLPVITPHLDKGRAMQLNTIYNRLRKNEIGKDEFVRHEKYRGGPDA